MDDEVSCAAVLPCVSPSNPSCLSLYLVLLSAIGLQLNL